MYLCHQINVSAIIQSKNEKYSSKTVEFDSFTITIHSIENSCVLHVIKFAQSKFCCCYVMHSRPSFSAHIYFVFSGSDVGSQCYYILNHRTRLLPDRYKEKNKKNLKTHHHQDVALLCYKQIPVSTAILILDS